jgi:hypothetical protein
LHFFLAAIAKGQLISKGLFDVIVSTKNTNGIFLRISALEVGFEKIKVRTSYH